MEHVEITLSLELKSRAEALARQEGVSLEELFRELLDTRLKAYESAERDPLFARYRAFDGDAPTDLAENHDKYLYDDE